MIPNPDVLRRAAVVFLLCAASSQLAARDLPSPGAGPVPLRSDTATGDASHRVPDIMLFGADSTGMHDSTPAFAAAARALGPGGGTVTIPAQGKFLLDTDLTVPPNVSFTGPHVLNGSPGTNVSARYDVVSGAILLNPSATIRLSGGAGFDGVLVYRKGMRFPAPDAVAFAGTAFTVAGDDSFLIRSQVMGFNKAFLANGFQRVRVHDLWHDNTNGIEIAACTDVSYIRDNHAWPFATIRAGAAPAALQRSGVAYYFHDVGDWNKSTNNFSYGYRRGQWLDNVNSMTLLGAAHDNTTHQPGSIGIAVTGTSQDTRIVLGQAAAQEIGIYINTRAGLHTTIQAVNTWANSGQSILVDGGNVTIQGSFRDAPYGVTINNAASHVNISGSYFTGMKGRPIHNAAGSPFVTLGANDYGDLAAGQSAIDGAVLQTIVASEPLNLPPTGELFVVTGSTDFNTVKGAWPGRRVTLKFTGRLSVGMGASNVQMPGRLFAKRNTVWSILGDGPGSFVETGRSIN